ncbi:MAG: terminase small subunit [Roseburia sp.]|nr:terminase small subunit [Roseburia sp.]
MEKNYEQAEKDYINGMKYKEIAEKYGVSLDTVKSWKTRYGWIRGGKKSESKSVRTKNEKVRTQKSERKSVLAQDENELPEDEELNEKMQQFCVFYVKSFNATKSYMKAYGVDYASAAVGANRLLKKDKIKRFIKDLKAQRASIMLFEPEDLVQKYMDIAFADMREFADINEDGTGIEVKKDFDGTLVSQLKETKYGLEVKINDRMKAMEWLGKYFECNPDSRLKNEYTRMQMNLLKNQESQDEEEKERHGVVMLAPVLEVEETNECIVDAATETD